VIPLSRRIRAADGAFGGTITGTIDPSFSEEFSRTLKLGPDSNIGVRDVDGSLIASFGFKTAPAQMSSVVKRALSASKEGHVWGNGAVDGVSRLVSYRVVEKYPLIVAIGEAEHHIFKDAAYRRTIYVEVGAVVTIFIIAFITNILRRERLLEISKATWTFLRRPISGPTPN